MFYSVPATCRANDVTPDEHLADVLGRINDHPINRIEELPPCNWKSFEAAGSTSTVASTSSLPVARSASRHWTVRSRINGTKR
ncbi:transposase domain-containing protein [Paraburkholderia caffeinitolerans]|uniref:transposase domain-containing protein n=1 Tax=Paraburkholderia caffeinitolerans TaxID=1723730 RepID=UPI0015817852|nr:transposase domain-containing protein [Paraburkholderia caffeinitolerans]